MSNSNMSAITKAYHAGAHWETRTRLSGLVPRSCYMGMAPAYKSRDRHSYFLKPGFGAGHHSFTLPADTFCKGFHAIQNTVEAQTSTSLVFLINTNNTKYNTIDECNIAGMNSQAFAVSMPTPGDKETMSTYYATSESIIRKAFSEVAMAGGRREWDMAAENVHVIIRKPYAPTDENGEIPVVYLGRHSITHITGKKVHLKRHRWTIDEEDDSHAGTIANPTEYHVWKRFRTRAYAPTNPGSSVQMLNMLAHEASLRSPL